MTLAHKRGYLALGIALIAIFWYVNWTGSQLRTHWAFFPLWLGYICTVDALAVFRGRRSLFLSDWKTGALLFLISVPLWWLFEWLNARAEYWIYIPENAFSPAAHTFWSTICFSTVVPAIFATVNLLLSFGFFRRHHFTGKVARTETGRKMYLISGIAMLVALLIWPQYGMAFMWISLYFIFDPVNVWLARPSLMEKTAHGDWRMVLILFSTALICGFFWELWNWYAWPKWIYTFPLLDGMKVFEMPLAGYLGYLPFGLEVWAMTAMLLPGFCRKLAGSLEIEE